MEKWTYQKQKGHRADGLDVWLVLSFGRVVASTNTEHDAVAIVREHNSHEALKAACKAAREWLSAFGEHVPTQAGGEAALDAILGAAIAAAEKEAE